MSNPIFGTFRSFDFHPHLSFSFLEFGNFSSDCMYRKGFVVDFLHGDFLCVETPTELNYPLIKTKKNKLDRTVFRFCLTFPCL